MGTSVCLHVKSKKVIFLIFRRKININRSSKIFLPHPSGLLVSTPDTHTHIRTPTCALETPVLKHLNAWTPHPDGVGDAAFHCHAVIQRHRTPRLQLLLKLRHLPPPPEYCAVYRARRQSRAAGDGRGAGGLGKNHTIPNAAGSESSPNPDGPRLEHEFESSSKGADAEGNKTYIRLCNKGDSPNKLGL